MSANTRQQIIQSEGQLFQIQITLEISTKNNYEMTKLLLLLADRRERTLEKSVCWDPLSPQASSYSSVTPYRQYLLFSYDILYYKLTHNYHRGVSDTYAYTSVI